jgi:tetratricopeptide (TPR) repeat protein
MSRYGRAATLLALVSLPGIAHAQDAADAAWRQGDTQTARSLYAERLSADSTDDQALHRMALMLAWEGRYDEGIALFDRLLALSPDNGDAAVDRARVLAWSGNTDAAARSLTAILAADPGNLTGWLTLSQVESWQGRFDEALATLDRAAVTWPDNRRIAMRRARVLAEAGRLDESVAAYETLVRSDESDLQAHLGLARTLAWSGQYAAAEAEYERIQARWPDNAEALAGWARIASWRGDLIEGETRWRRAVEAQPESVSLMAGLGETLRWQGRDAAAYEALSAAAEMDPQNAEVRAELDLVAPAFQPFAAPSLGYQTDSDGNRIFTTTVAGGWNATPTIRVQGSAYMVQARQVGAFEFSEGSAGLMAEVGVYLDPGWTISGGLGASASGATGVGAIPAGEARISTPARNRVAGSFGFTARALDETATLIRNGVKYALLNGDIRFTPSQEWRIAGGAGIGRFDGSEFNRRLDGWADARRRLSREWSVGLAVRSFGFEKNLNDGYFDPNFYILAQVPVAWSLPVARWAVSVRVAPGVEQIGSQGSPRGALGAAGEVGYAVSPGRQVSAWAGYSSTGMAAFATGSADYRYGTFGVRGTWTF